MFFTISRIHVSKMVGGGSAFPVLVARESYAFFRLPPGIVEATKRGPKSCRMGVVKMTGAKAPVAHLQPEYLMRSFAPVF